MQKTNGDRVTCFGIALLAQLALHCGRSVLLNAVSERMSDSTALPYAYGVLSLLLKAAVFLIPTLVYLRLSGAGFSALLAPVGEKNPREMPFFYKALQWIAAAAIMLNAVNLVGMGTDAIYRALGLDTAAAPLPTDVGLQVISFVSSVILAPFLEEMLFRGVALNALSGFGKRAVLISGMLFALMHYQIYVLPYAFVAGCIIASMARKANSLRLAVGLHFSNNLLTFVSMLIDFYVGDAAAEAFGYVLTAVTLPIAVFGIVMLVRERRSHAPSAEEAGERAKPRLSFGVVLYALMAAMICITTR